MNQVSSKSSADTVRAVSWTDQGLKVLDQRVLPDVVRYDVCSTADAVADAIATMRVRGAPAIGVAAAFGVVLAARERYREDPADWKHALAADLDVLARSRPTAVNLFWALDLMKREIAQLNGDPFPQLLSVAERVHAEDIAANRQMGELGADLLDAADGLLTHCNTGSLATGGYGTALGVVRSACARRARRVFATETRPWRQGARLTVWELAGDGIAATLLADSAAPYLMSRGSVQWVIVGADRIAANGDTANKIGTYALAVAAKQHGVKFMVVAPSTTIDTETASGAGIEIEERSAAELLPEVFLAADSIVSAWNPVFDVTPASLIDAIVTEHGVIQNPSRESLASLVAMLRQQRQSIGR